MYCLARVVFEVGCGPEDDLHYFETCCSVRQIDCVI